MSSEAIAISQSGYTTASSTLRSISAPLDIGGRIAGIFLVCAAASSVLITTAIICVLLLESSVFFSHVSMWEFLTDKQWTPLFADAHFGILPLICGTVVTTFIALLVALPVGTTIAIFLSEYTRPWLREILKPTLELLAAVPTVVYGYFALLFISPILQKIFTDMSAFSMLSAGLVMGIMIIPYVASLSEDAMRAVPMDLREGSYGLGANKLTTALKVVFPAALSGIGAAYILAISRAVGETMIVAIAAGMQPQLTLNPSEPAATITAYIVQVSLGDLPHGSIGYQSIFAAGVVLFALTLCLNIVGHFLRKKFRQVY